LNTVSKTVNRTAHYLNPQFLVADLGDVDPEYFAGRAKMHRVWDTCHAHAGFEYRLVLSWLSHPVIARGTLTLAKLIGKIQITFGDTELATVNTENIIEYANKFETRHIKRFYDMVKMMLRRRIKLESYDIIKTWRVGKHGRAAKANCALTYTSDDFMALIFEDAKMRSLKTATPVRFIGTGNHRANGAKAVCLPADSQINLPGTIRWIPVVKLDDYYNREPNYQAIGLTPALRGDIEQCRKVVKAIVAYLNRPRAAATVPAADAAADPAVVAAERATTNAARLEADIREYEQRAGERLVQLRRNLQRDNVGTLDPGMMVVNEPLTPAQADACRDIHTPTYAERVCYCERPINTNGEEI
jgi:hypothetical protein